jgi:hypothetical protein
VKGNVAGAGGWYRKQSSVFQGDRFGDAAFDAQLRAVAP